MRAFGHVVPSKRLLSGFSRPWTPPRAPGPGSRSPGPCSNEVAGPAEALLDLDRYREEARTRAFSCTTHQYTRARTIVAKSSLWRHLHLTATAPKSLFACGKNTYPYVSVNVSSNYVNPGSLNLKKRRTRSHIIILLSL